MTCRQVRQLLAAYRRDDCSPAEHAELEAHLEDCAECRARDAEFRRVGKSVQLLPQLAPPPDFFARVMAAVQADAARATEQKKPETVVVPGLTNISHYPRLRQAVAERKMRLAPMRTTTSPAMTFTLRYGAALAATFLIFAVGLSVALYQWLGVPATGSVLHGPPPLCINIPCPSPLTSASIPDSAYPIVGDAAASVDGQYIVYAAHTPQGSWMLEELNRRTGKSVALLPAPVAGPLTIQGWALSWVLWSQGDPSSSEHWQLNATELSPALPGAPQTLQLLGGGLSGKDGPVMTLQGVHAYGSMVLLAERLKDEHGQLVQLDLNQESPAARSVVATAPAGHWIADPTTDGSVDYWAEEWLDPDGTAHGNIMRLEPAGRPQPITSNNVSFAPMLVANNLVWLEETHSEATQIAVKSAPTPTATPTGQTSITPSGGSASNAPVTGTLWSEKPDASVLDLDNGTQTQIADGVSMPQAGATFVFWQTKTGDFYLYDFTQHARQPLNSTISNALVLAVSPTAVLWVTADTQNSSQLPARTNIILMEWPQLHR